MTLARIPERPFPLALVYGAGALVAALVVSAVVLLGSFEYFGPATPATPEVPTPAVLRSEASWMTQRLAQSGYIEPSVRSAQMWERQRLQQTPTPR